MYTSGARRVLTPVFPTFVRGVEFISRPNALGLPRMAPFDCFDYPYLIPRSSSLQSFSNHSRRTVSSFPSILILHSRDIEKRLYMSQRHVLQRSPSSSVPSRRRRGNSSPQVYTEIPDGFHLRQNSSWSTLEIQERKEKERNSRKFKDRKKSTIMSNYSPSLQRQI